MTTLSLEHFLPNGHEPADIAAAIEVAGATRVALVAACVGVENFRLDFEARGDEEGAKLLGEAAAKLKARAVTLWNVIAALKALDSDWTTGRDKALDARLETMAADAEGGRWMIDMSARFLKLAMSEVYMAALELTAAENGEVADAG